MAKLEQVISGDFYEVLGKIERGIVEGSMSASLEEFSDFESGTARCSVRVFERYSYVGDNRVSLNVTLFQNGSGPIQLSADRKSTRLNSSHVSESRMPSSA